MMALSNDDWERFDRKFQTVADQFHSHALEDERRFTELESWHRGMNAEARRRGTWAGIVAAAGLSSLLEVVRIWLHR